MIQILKATLENAELIAKIGKESFIESHGNSASIEDINLFIQKNYSINSIRQELRNPNLIYHIIYFDMKAAGFSKIELNINNKDIVGSNVTKLDRLYLLKSFYNQSLGSKLLDFNIQLSRQNKQRGIWLAVWVENERAINFYKKTGFEVVGKYSFQISKSHSNPNHIMYLKF